MGTCSSKPKRDDSATDIPEALKDSSHECGAADEPRNAIPRSHATNDLVQAPPIAQDITAASLPSQSRNNDSSFREAIATPPYPFREPAPFARRPPRHLHNLSELIDPSLLFAGRDVVKSPSGNVLDQKSFSDREDRPLSLRERQERIRNGLQSGGRHTLSGLEGNNEQADIPRLVAPPATMVADKQEVKHENTKRWSCF